jgi:hypothetical protein
MKPVCSARKDKVVDRTAVASQPIQQARPRRFEKLELHRPSRLLLGDGCPLADATSACHVADPHLDEITSAKLAVDRKIEQRPIS